MPNDRGTCGAVKGRQPMPSAEIWRKLSEGSAATPKPAATIRPAVPIWLTSHIKSISRLSSFKTLSIAARVLDKRLTPIMG